MKGKSAAQSSSSTKLPSRTKGPCAQSSSPSRLVAKHNGVQALLLQSPVATTNNVQDTPVSTSQQVSVEQSSQIMQTLLHACLSSVLFQRSIFPANCYETRYYVNNSDQWTYKDYLGAHQGIIKGDGAGGPMLALKKGVSARVDRFLDLLENGIFDAMQRGFLRSLRLSIYEDSKQPNDILESWTLTIHYADVSSAREPLACSLDVKGQRGAHVTLHEAKLSVNDFIRKLTGMCLALPALPAEKNIVMEILYANERPESYFAPGFPHPVYELARFPSNKQWERLTSDVALMSTSHHAASLRVSHLRNVVSGEENSLPCAMICTEEVSKMDEVMSDLEEQATAILHSRPKSKKWSVSGRLLPQPQEAIQKKKKADGSPTVASPMPSSPAEQCSGGTRPSSVLAQPSGSFETLMKCTAADRMEQEQLRSMLRTPPIGSNSQATQPVANVTRLVFSPSKIDQVDRERDATLPARKEASQIWTAYEHNRQLTIQCTCGHKEEEGDMIECEFCKTYQHIHCCGYVGKQDGRLPLVYVCYVCLLGKEEEGLHGLRDQSVYRRALWLLKNTSFDDAKALAQALHCTKAEVERLVQRFRGQGLVTPSAGRGKPRRGAITMSDSSDAWEMARRWYFDPSFGIAEYLEGRQEAKGQGGNLSVRPSKREWGVGGEEEERCGKRMMSASGARFINGNESNTPKTSKKQ